MLADGFNESEGERCAEALLVKQIPFTALVCSNDRLAVGAIGALRRHGLAIPGDISVTGFNDMPLVDRLEPALTTIRVQQYSAGRLAAQTLLARLEHRDGVDAARHKVLPVELVVRASTAPPPDAPGKVRPRRHASR